MPESKTITVDLGNMQSFFEERVGAYGSASELIQEALRALKREEEYVGFDDDFLRQKVEESLADPRPSIPAEEVFERLERKYREDMKTKRGK